MKTTMKKIMLCGSLLVMLLLAACGSKEQKAPSDTAIIFTDDLGREVTVENPKRVAALLGSFAQVWQLAGGEVIATADDAWDDLGLTLPEDTVNLGNTKRLNLELLLTAQPDFIPEEKPEFGESVERRKDRILYMNTVREQGAEAREGAMAQLLLLSKVPPVRPMKLALALLRKETAEIPAVTRKNSGILPQLPKEAVIEGALVLKDGKDETPAIRVPEALADILCEVDRVNRLAAKAAFGDREALREYVETDPALDGLDRLYCLDVVNALIGMHEDVLTHFSGMNNE